MQFSRSPPKYARLTSMGGSMAATTTATATAATATAQSSADSAKQTPTLISLASLSTTSPLPSTAAAALTTYKREGNGSFGSSSTLNSNCSNKSRLLESSTESLTKPLYYQHSHAHSHGHHHHQHHHNYHHYSHHSHGSNGSGNGAGSGGSARSMSSTGKRGRKKNWGTRERTGMSFLIVIAFFAVFGLIILTEFFMIDERSHSAMVMMRHGGNYGGRLGDSMPDYDNVKDDYDLLDESILGDNKLGFVQFRDNKLKIQEAGNNDAGRLAGILLNSGGINGYGMGIGGGAGGGGGGLSGGLNIPQIPWGKVLPTKIEETLPPYPIGMPPMSGSWQVVNGTRFKFFVFSAYYDQRYGVRLVRIIGATKTRGPERVWCRFWYLNRNVSNILGERDRHRYTSVTVMARVKIIRENWNLKYSACFILCPVRSPEVEVPQYVSVVSRLRAPPGNLLTLKNTDWDPDFASQQGNQSASNQTGTTAPKPTSKIPHVDQIADKIAVCVKPFHFNYDQALYLMEYLELYALLGVSHFTFYNHTLGPHATCVLEHYINGDIPDNLTATDGDVGKQQVFDSAPASNNNQNNHTNGKHQNAHADAYVSPPKTLHAHPTSSNYIRPTVNILPWNLRMRSQKEIRTEGLFAALNDCVYRNMYRYKYLALVDLDEFIVPRHNDTLYDLISSLNHRFPNRNIGAYSFQNAFFYLQFPDDPIIYQKTSNHLDARMRAALVTQRKTKRRYKLHPQKQRSKYICKPESVLEAGNHFVWEFAPGKGSLNVAPTEAILQHYRVCEFGGNDCIKAPSVVDRTATKYVNRLVQRVQSVYEHLKTTCDLPELPMLPKQMPKTENDDSNDDSNNNKNNEIEADNKNLKKSSQTRTEANGNEKPKPPASSVKNLTTSKNHQKAAEAHNATSVSTSAAVAAAPISTAKTNMPTTTIKAKKYGEEKVPPQKNENEKENQQRKRKIVVFEHDENGLPRARVKYV